MRESPARWELFAVGLAVGGTGVWALSASARVGVLRRLLEMFPRGTWDAVTWVLIPALLVIPIVVQGAAVAAFAGSLAAWAGAAWAAIAGAGAALTAIGAVLLVLIRRLPHPAQAWLGRNAPEALIVAFTAAIAAGWLIAAERVMRLRTARGAAVPAAIALTAVAWVRAHHTVIALSYVLDRPEVNAFFAAVALGGGAGSAWSASRAARMKAEAPAAGDRRKMGVTHGV